MVFIDSGAFNEGPRRIWVDKNNENYSNDEFGSLFNKDKTTLIANRGSSIPEGITEIAPYAFYEQTLDEIKLPDSLISIGNAAFCYCNSNAEFELIIPDNVVSIGNGAFDSSGLKEIQLGSSVKTIGSRCFCDSRITSIHIPSNVETIGQGCFSDTGVKTITIDKPADSIPGAPWGANDFGDFEIIWNDGAVNYP